MRAGQAHKGGILHAQDEHNNATSGKWAGISQTASRWRWRIFSKIEKIITIEKTEAKKR
jgi:hypothetical protein